ncbi:hypothetical protein PNOK_0944900 [Pyrrhoderma noxium]|uniref:Uncharacterized protein n=1 Tax=Pyrrhoderma noxium TaxID=2282107 RepID=A0A286U5N1_9AGAM|nr:hypothetical protein PNOK_0944900 [Pyrrhoderma noxium]
MPRGVDVSGARMGMEKRRFMSEEEENSLVDRALKSVRIGIDVASRSQGQVQAYAQVQARGRIASSSAGIRPSHNDLSGAKAN